MDKDNHLERPDRGILIAAGYFAVFHLVGVAGFHIPELTGLFQQLVPFHLLATAGVLFYFQNWQNRSIFIFICCTWLATWLIEAIGVSTGLIFGSYSYGPTLGFSLAGTPVLIGLNWIVLLITSAAITDKLISNPKLKPVFGAGLMVLTDFFIEPVAMTFEYWTWEGNQIPVQNYLSWFLISLALHFFYRRLKPEPRNPAGHFLFIIQFLFFASFWVLEMAVK